MTDSSVDPSMRYLADTIAASIEKGFRHLAEVIAEERPDGPDNLANAIREGFGDLGSRIGQGDGIGGTENLAIPLMRVAEALDSGARNT